MKDCSPSVAPIKKSDKLSINQCSKNDLENESMKNIPYDSAVDNLMYARVCTRPDIAYVVGVLGRYQSNPCMDHWGAAKKVMRYLISAQIVLFRALYNAGFKHFLCTNQLK